MLPASITQPLLVATVVSMVLGALIIKNNKRIVRLMLREEGPGGEQTALARDDAATAGPTRREHVILCGFGRVGQNVARVVMARQAGDPVIFGDSADEDVLRGLGLDKASALVVSFSDPSTALAIIRAVRRLQPELPVLVRTQDDTRDEELKEAGVTEVVPETFEASLMLVSHALLLLNVPMSKVVLPPSSWSVGRSLAEIRGVGAEVAFTAVRRNGILGREPDNEMRMRDGDIVVIYGLPESLEHAEAVLLAG